MGGHASTVASAIVFLLLPIIFVILRLCARAKYAPRLGIDDLLIVPALVCHVGVCACAIIRVFIGEPVSTDRSNNLQQEQKIRFVASQPGSSSDADKRVAFHKTSLALSLLVVAADGLVKLSLLFLYRRLFATKITFRRVNTLLIVVITAWTTAVFICIPVLCVPLNEVLDFPELPEITSHCDISNALYLGYTASDVLTDILVLISPIAAVWSLQMRTGQKFGVSLVFLLGFVSVAAGAVRVAEFVVARNSFIHRKDIILFSVEVVIWSMVESGLGIICACLPCLPALFRFRCSSRSQRPTAELRGELNSYTSEQARPSQHSRSLRRIESLIALQPLRAQTSSLAPR